jgi:hypothetical protein
MAWSKLIEIIDDKNLDIYSGEWLNIAIETLAQGLVIQYPYMTPFIAIVTPILKSVLDIPTKIRLKKVEKFIDKRGSNSHIWNSDLFQDPQFIDTLLNTLKFIISSNSQAKQEIATNIFIGYANNVEKEQTEIDKYLNGLNMLGVKWLEYLHFLREEWYPLHRTYVEEEIYPQNSQKLSDEFTWIPKEEAIRELFLRFPISVTLSKHKIDMWRGEFHNIWLSELLSAGMVRESDGGWAIGGWITTYYLTDFWYRFMAFLSKDIVIDANS